MPIACLDPFPVKKFAEKHVKSGVFLPNNIFYAAGKSMVQGTRLQSIAIFATAASADMVKRALRCREVKQAAPFGGTCLTHARETLIHQAITDDPRKRTLTRLLRFS